MSRNPRIKVVFTRTIILPRFTMGKGETWNVLAKRFRLSGFTLGDGHVSPEYFQIVDFDGRN